MGDTHTYHRIVGEMFIECKDPYDITFEVTEHDARGKPKKVTKRLSDVPSSSTRNQQIVSGAAQLEEWKKRSAELKAQAQVASSPDG